ncbi:MAG: PxKF domain-containing protein [Thermomicrobiales bacterium]|nr:PxKF domain-containing protein [Thermomicrobiales bacterium]
MFDGTPPVITYTLDPAIPSGDNGWYVGDVTLTWTVIDLESPDTLSQVGCADQTINADQMKTTYSCQATSSGGAAAQVDVIIGRDATAPVVTVAGVADGSTYPASSVPVASCTTTDATSGVATQATVSTTGGPVGDITVTCAGATDNAGNTAAAASATYSVQYDWNGFSGVVKNQPKATTWIALLPVPVLFSIDGNQGRDAVTSITSRSCSNAPGVGEVSAGSLFNIGVVSLGRSDQYLFIWTTPRSWARTCRVLTVTLADGTSHEAIFNFK